MMSDSSPTHRRSRWFVDPQLQGTVVKRILLHWLAFLAMGTFVAVVVRVLTNPTVPLAQQWDEMIWAFGPFLITMLALLPVFVMDTIKLTNRYAGPFVRFRTHLRALVEDKHPGPIRFRDGDHWRETESSLNLLLMEIEQLRSDVRQAGAISPDRGASSANDRNPMPPRPSENTRDDLGDRGDA
ncbi:MAG: hypothetical protein KF861_21485 [Planctomycetaceae bacterium]|nr:hypothetical protein [Planctomycetaceae bacterium]